MTPALLSVSAIAPSLLILLYVHRRDVFPEPPRILWATFGLGVASTVPAVLLAIPGELATEGISSPLAYGFVNAFVAAAIPEELLKFLVLWGFAMRRSSYDEPMDGIVYGVAASLGFATLENVLYVATGGVSVAVLRAVTAVPAHALFGAVMGLLLSRSRMPGDRRPISILWALGVPTVLHGLYNFPLLAAQRAGDPENVSPALAASVFLVPLVLFGSLAISLRELGRARAAQLSASLAGDRHPMAAAAVARDHERRWLFGWLFVAIGFVAVSGGSLVTLAILVGMTAFGVETHEIPPMLFGTAVLGLLPTALGLWLFVAGTKRLNESTAARSGRAGRSS